MGFDYFKDFKEISREVAFGIVGAQAKTIVEIGACDGDDTVRFMINFPKCKVYSVEPKPQNIASWKKKYTGNPRTSLFEGVVSDVDGTVDLYVSDDKYTGCSSIREPTKRLAERWPDMRFPQKISVQSITLDSLVKKYNIDVVDFLWIDAQGAEDKIINGGIETLNTKVKSIFIEISLEEIYSGQTLVEDMIKMLPNFEIIGRFQDNLFMVNKNLRPA